MKKQFIFCIFCIIFSVEMLQSQNESFQKAKSATDYVDPFIGTSDANAKQKNLVSNFSAGNTYPGAVTPWGMTAISPRNTIESINKGEFAGNPSGYIYGQEYFYGFGQIHLSGVGCSEWGNVLVMPTVGNMSSDINLNKSKYSEEEASPGYYKLMLNDFNIIAEVSATTRTTITKFTCKNGTDDMNVVIDLYHAIQGATDGHIKITSDTTVEGWNQNGGFCGQKAQRKVYFVAQFSKSAKSFYTFKNGKVFEKNQEQNGAITGGILKFKMKQNEKLYLKIGISFVSIDNARLNLQTEQPSWNFEQVRSNARKAWNENLSRIKVEGGTEDSKTEFYTALYHALIHPSICSDVNGEYRAMGENGVKRLTGKQKNQYNVYSLWDTYRNLDQLITLVYPERKIDMIRTMVDQAKESGFLPKWEISGNETYVMVGDPACIVIADAYLKGLTDFDINAAYRIMIKSSTLLKDNPIRPALAQYIKHGYIPQDRPNDMIWGSVSTSLEYNLADYAIAQLANSLGNKTDYTTYLKRSKGYKYFYDPKTTFLRAKNENGSWHEPFNADTIRGSMPGANFPCGGVGYTEGNAWQYNFFVPHDIKGLIELMGKYKYIDKLRACFANPERFVLFNEPDMAYPYLFNYVAGNEYYTQEMVRKSINYYFANNKGGLPGNDDCGTTSSWLIFSSIGFYPACPVSTDYQIGSPVFDKVTIQLNQDFYKGKEFVIETNNNSRSNIYIQNMKLNGKEYKNYFLNHKDITNGGVWKLNMGNNPLK